MEDLVRGDERSEGGEREVDTGERNQVGLEFVQVDIEGTSETKRRGNRGNDLSDETVQIGEAWLRNTQVLLADVEDGLIVNLPTRLSAGICEITEKRIP